MMGIVYEAQDPVLGRTLALKTVKLGFVISEQDREAFEKRFLVEASAAARLSHPGIVVVYDVGTDSQTGALFMALEYLRGTTLETMISSGKPLDWRRALQITRQVAAALHHAHAHGIVHRDIKPANIMVLESGEPKIMDFGIAKLPAGQLTASGQILGSPSYMSPERARDEPVDARSDLFSLGVVLYELLTGKRPFRGSDVAAILMRVSSEDPPPPTKLTADLPVAVDGIVARALAKAPSDRYPDGETLARDLEDVLEGRPPRLGGRAARPKPLPVPQVEAAPGRLPLAGEATAAGGASEDLCLPPGKRVSLAILDGPHQGEIFTLDRPQVVIGRTGGGSGAHMEIPDPEISRAHTALECRGRQIVLRDLNSTNGTFVGEERISDRELEDHDEFRVGRTRLMLILADLE
jgi:serine/threonine-protein kinase